MIRAETAKVYKSLNGKRYFTKKSAIKNSVLFKLKKKHEKEGCIDRLVGGEHEQDIFYTDEQWSYFNSVADRYYRFFVRKSPHLILTDR